MSKVWLAPAKINRFLHITGQRADGYHELQTVFQFLDFSDELSFKVLDDDTITLLNSLPGVKPDDDLTVRAARLLQQQAKCTKGVEISINKRLPMGGGLGGGSSDAATTLVALNQLWQINFELLKLAELGVRLGADVPVFIHGCSAWAEGVGEQLSAIHLDEPWFVVLNPSVNVSTAEIFASPELKRNCAPITIEHFFSGNGENVCEPVVGALYPEVQGALQWLAQYAPARMTGTGACVFAAMASEQEARQVLAQSPEKFHGFVAKGQNISPLYTMP